MSSVFLGKSALVTGASSGLGAEFARQLAADGVATLILAARREDRLKTLRQQLLTAHPALRVEIVVADLATTAGCETLMHSFSEQTALPDILINNAGFGDIGPFETSEPARIDAMVGLNIASLTRLTRWLLPKLLERKAGWICQVGSTAGFLPLPTFAVYAASKAYVNSFAEALRTELHGSGVNVTALCPGPVATEFGQAASRPDGKRKFATPAGLTVPASEVVRDALHSLESGGGRVIPGWTVRVLTLLVELTPRSLLRSIFNLSSGQFRRERQQARDAAATLPPIPPPPPPTPNPHA